MTEVSSRTARQMTCHFNGGNMTEERQKEYYGIINSIWKNAKSGDPSALLAIDIAKFVADYVSRANGPDEFWTEFAKQLHALAVRYAGNRRAEMMIDTVAHALMQTVTKAGVA